MTTPVPKLALLGGKPILNAPLTDAISFGLGEADAVRTVLESGCLSGFVAKAGDGFYGGPWVRKLEKYFEQYFSAKYAVAFNSATSALFAAIYAIGTETGDEIILPPFTMSATASAILMRGGVPIFVDIIEEDLCINPDQILPAITNKTRAIIPVHLMGNAAPMNRIMEIARARGLQVVEDCAQAPGAEFQGKKVGTFGDIGIFSFNRHKVVQSGEGGVAITDDSELALKMQLIRNHAEGVSDQMTEAEDFALVGGNFRMTELEAAVATVQMGRLGALNAKRRRFGLFMNQCLSKIPWIVPQRNIPGVTSVYYRFPFRYIKEGLGIKRATLAKALSAEGFPVNEGYEKPLHLQSIYQKGNANDPYLRGLYFNSRQNEKGLCPVAERLWEEELLLTPITHQAHDFGDIETFMMALNKIASHRDALLGYEASFAGIPAEHFLLKS